MGTPNAVRRKNTLIDKRTRKKLLPAVAASPTDERPLMVPQDFTLPGNEHLLDLYNYVVNDAKQYERYSPSYTFTYEQLVRTVAQLQKDWPLLQQEGSVVPVYSPKTGDQIGMQANPRAKIIAALQRNLLTLIGQLGLSPRAVQYLMVTPANPHGGGLPDDQSIAESRKPRANAVVLFR